MKAVRTGKGRRWTIFSHGEMTVSELMAPASDQAAQQQWADTETDRHTHTHTHAQRCLFHCQCQRGPLASLDWFINRPRSHAHRSILRRPALYGFLTSPRRPHTMDTALVPAAAATMYAYNAAQWVNHDAIKCRLINSVNDGDLSWSWFVLCK